MEDHFFAGWFTVSRNGSDAPRWLEMLALAGVETVGPDAPIWFDRTPRKPRNAAISFDSLPGLSNAIQSLRVARGLGCQGCLVVPNFGHFVTSAIWKEAWRRIEEVGGVAQSASPLWRVTNLEDGLKLLASVRGRTASERKMKARIAIGRPVKKMAPNKKVEMIQYFGDQDWTVPAIAKHCGVGEMTVRRRMLEWAGTNSKEEAVTLALSGKWPPKRKLR